METSKAEFKVVAHTAAGYEAKEIADKLFRSYHTVVGHLKQVRIKNGFKNTADITREFVLAHGDPKQYIKTLILILQLSITFTAMDVDLRQPRVRKPTRTQRVSKK